MPAAKDTAILADAADVLSDQLREHLQRLSKLLDPHAEGLERRFVARLKKIGFDSRERAAVAAITPGAAAKILVAGNSVAAFFEQVEYNGRRLAKLNLAPSRVVEALQHYDRLLTPTLQVLFPNEYANFQWVREQLHFCVILTLNNAYYQVREAETQAFYELFRVELESRNLDELLHKFLKTLVEVCCADAGHLFLLESDSAAWEPRASAFRSAPKKILIPDRVLNNRHRLKSLSSARSFKTGKVAANLLLDGAWRRTYASCWSIPLAANGKVSGVLQFAFSKEYDWLPREQDLLAAAAERCLMAAEKARLMEDLAQREEQVRQLAEHMLHVEEVERRRISRELHDEAGQSLLCIRLQIELLEHSMPEEQTEWRSKLQEARDLTERTILEMRRLIAALSPAVLEQLGLGAALRQLVTRFRRLHPCRVRLHMGKMGTLPNQTEIIVYRLVQECCNNIAKHSAATHVNISLTSADGVLRLLVEDNGVGFKVEEALQRRDSFGLSGIQERVALLGGKFEVESRPAGSTLVRPARGSVTRGSRILVDLPIPPEGKRMAPALIRWARPKAVAGSKT